MTIRATFQFAAARGFQAAVTFYVKYDGHEEGAASYLWSMLHARNKRGGLADQFFRANEHAEIADGHDCHATYQYTIEGWILTARRIDLGKGGFGVVYSGPLHEFINTYPGLIEGFEPIRPVTRPYHPEPRYVTKSDLLADIADALQNAIEYRKKFQDQGTLAAMMAEVQARFDLLKQYEAQK